MRRTFASLFFLSVPGIVLVSSLQVKLPVYQLKTTHCRQHKLKSAANNSEDANPDLVGVHVDGYPLPPTPSRSDDKELLARLQNVPGHDLFCTDNNDDKLTSPPKSTLFERRTLTAERPLRVLVAGGGMGGLAAASALLRKGFDVHVLEQAVKYKPFGGPIQLQSNALWALQQIAPELYDAVKECGVQTGDRLSGIKDGLRYQEGWLVKFDAATPAREKGLPLTLAINRVVLQAIFLKYGVPPERIHTNARVVSYNNTGSGRDGVSVTLENGETVYGDVLVGADGIWSRVRHQMCRLPTDEVGIRYAAKHASYSGYTCFTGTCRHVPADIETVAYKVFLGQQQYLGCTDAGHGWQHWWAFLPDAPSSTGTTALNSDGKSMLERLEREFAGWSPEIHDLFRATKPEVVRQRDLFDRKPMWNGWTDSARANVVLLGGMFAWCCVWYWMAI